MTTIYGGHDFKGLVISLPSLQRAIREIGTSKSRSRQARASDQSTTTTREIPIRPDRCPRRHRCNCSHWSSSCRPPSFLNHCYACVSLNFLMADHLYSFALWDILLLVLKLILLLLLLLLLLPLLQMCKKFITRLIYGIKCQKH